MKNNKNLITIICAIGVFFLGIGFMYGIIYFFPTSITTITTKLEKDVTVTDKGIADAVEKVYDAVVVVKTYKEGKVYSSGTGFVYKTEKDDAYILTNTHVIDKGDQIKVVFTNGNEEEVKVVGCDEYADVALLSIDKDKIVSVAEIGKSDELRVGDTTFAVGAPLDSAYSWSVTRGIISGKDRMIEVSVNNSQSADWVMSVLQTDTAINSGNSGGPLANSNGEVIGITSLKLVSDGVEGMGFAIPIETAIDYANKFISGEKITQPYLGVSMINVSEAYYYNDFYNYVKDSKLEGGVVIAEVEKNSAADKAGLKVGDIITSLNDNEVTNVAYLRYYLYKYKAGEKITVNYYRNGKFDKTTVTLGTKELEY